MSNIKDKNQLSAFLDYLDCPTIRLSSNYTILDMNRVALLIFGWKNQVMGENFFELLKKYKLKNTMLKKFNLLRNKENSNSISIKMNTEKQELTIAWKVFYQRNKNNTIAEIIPIGNDITQKVEMEDKIFELNSIISRMPNRVYWWDKNEKYLGCNENCAKVLGMSREEAVGKDLRMLMQRVSGYSEILINKSAQDGLDVMTTKAPKLNIEEPPFIGPDNKIVYMISNKVPLVNKNGEVYGVLGISTDITKHKELEEELKQSKKKSDVALMLMNKDTLKELVKKIKNRPIWLNIDSQMVQLTFRETECLLYLLRGETAKNIANEMNISPRTVETYIEALKDKTNTCSKTALANKAIMGGILDGLI